MAGNGDAMVDSGGAPAATAAELGGDATPRVVETAGVASGSAVSTSAARHPTPEVDASDSASSDSRASTGRGSSDPEFLAWYDKTFPRDSTLPRDSINVRGGDQSVVSMCVEPLQTAPMTPTVRGININGASADSADVTTSPWYQCAWSLCKKLLCR